MRNCEDGRKISCEMAVPPVQTPQTKKKEREEKCELDRNLRKISWEMAMLFVQTPKRRDYKHALRNEPRKKKETRPLICDLVRIPAPVTELLISRNEPESNETWPWICDLVRNLSLETELPMWIFAIKKGFASWLCYSQEFVHAFSSSEKTVNIGENSRNGGAIRKNLKKQMHG